MIITYFLKRVVTTHDIFSPQGSIQRNLKNILTANYAILELIANTKTLVHDILAQEGDQAYGPGYETNNADRGQVRDRQPAREEHGRLLSSSAVS